MARTNVRVPSPITQTHEGGHGARLTPEQELQRSVLACLLWERTFYEEGADIASRIVDLVGKVSPEFAADLMVKARSEYNLRHAPLLLAVALARRHALKAEALASTIQRADELSEFLALYWKDGKVPIAAQVKKGLAAAFLKFDAYQLARYQDGGAVKLRDVLFLVKPKPQTDEQAALWRKLANKELESPDTWEVALSGGADKKTTFERLLSEGRLGYMALLRNLRNMREAGVDKALVEKELLRGAGRSRVLPFRFVAAAITNPQWESMIEKAMLAALVEAPRIKGRTVLMVDVSGSMDSAISVKSDLNRIKAATALAMLCREVCEDVAIYSFSNQVVAIPDRRGFALAQAIEQSQPHGGTPLGAAIIEAVKQADKGDRLIVFTDEQAADRVGPPLGKGYMINVSSDEHGVGYGDWTRLTGFSEAVLEYVRQSVIFQPT